MNSKKKTLTMKIAELTAMAMMGVCAIASISSAQSPVPEGSGNSGGGNITESDFRRFMGKLDTYLLSDEGKTLFPEIAKWDEKNPEEKFHDVILNTKPVIQKGELRDAQGVVRDCMSYANPGQRYFVCNSDALPALTLDNQPSFYQIVLHELFVQTGIEKPLSKEVRSVYDVSSRITQNVHLETYQEWVPGKRVSSSVTLAETGILCSDYSPDQGRKELMYLAILPSGDYTLVKQKIPAGQDRYGLMQEQIGSKADERGYRFRAFVADLFNGDVKQDVILRGSSMSIFKESEDHSGRFLDVENKDYNFYASTTAEPEKMKRYNTSGWASEFLLHVQLVDKTSGFGVSNKSMVCKGFYEEGRKEMLPADKIFLSKESNHFKKNYIKENIQRLKKH